MKNIKINNIKNYIVGLEKKKGCLHIYEFPPKGETKPYTTNLYSTTYVHIGMWHYEWLVHVVYEWWEIENIAIRQGS